MENEDEDSVTEDPTVTDPTITDPTIVTHNTKQTVSSLPTAQTPNDPKYVLETIKIKKKVGFERSNSDTNSPDVNKESTVVDERSIQ